MTSPTAPRTGLMQVKPDEATRSYLNTRAVIRTTENGGITYPASVARELLFTGATLELDTDPVAEATGLVMAFAGEHNMTPAEALVFLIEYAWRTLGHDGLSVAEILADDARREAS